MAAYYVQVKIALEEKRAEARPGGETFGTQPMTVPIAKCRSFSRT